MGCWEGEGEGGVGSTWKFRSWLCEGGLGEEGEKERKFVLRDKGVFSQICRNQ